METGGALLQAVVGYLGTIELSLDSTAGGLQVDRKVGNLTENINIYI